MLTRLRKCSPALLEFPDTGKKLPVLKATNWSLQSVVASGGNRVGGRVTDAKATEFWRKKKKHILRDVVFKDLYPCIHNQVSTQFVKCKHFYGITFPLGQWRHLSSLYLTQAMIEFVWMFSWLTFSIKLFSEVLWEPVLQRNRSCCSWTELDVSFAAPPAETSRRWYAVHVIPVKWAGRIKWASITMFLETCSHRKYIIHIKLHQFVSLSQDHK